MVRETDGSSGPPLGKNLMYLAEQAWQTMMQRRQMDQKLMAAVKSTGREWNQAQEVVINARPIAVEYDGLWYGGGNRFLCECLHC